MPVFIRILTKEVTAKEVHERGTMLLRQSFQQNED